MVVIILVQRLRDLKTRLSWFLYFVPTSLLALLLLALLAYNGLSVFYVQVPLLSNISRQNHNLVKFSSHSSRRPDSASSSSKSLAASSSSSSIMYVVREENSLQFLKPDLLASLHKNQVSLKRPISRPGPKIRKPTRISRKKQKLTIKIKNKIILRTFIPEEQQRQQPPKKKKNKNDYINSSFSSRIKDFFGSGNNCTEPRFFMTWISSADSFGSRESFAVESLFKTHPSSCLVIVSRAMDSARGTEILRPFQDSGFKVIAVSPDYDYLFKKTPAERWFDRLRRGNVNPGEISLGQNLSNLVRLCLLYKYGGVYTDTDVIFLRSFSGLENAIGAQTMDPKTGHWSRLNNAVLVFDKNHPLLLRFISEFANTFNGNKWGHNGPYLVSRVVSRLGRNNHSGFGFSVLPPNAFYPVVWTGIRGLFRSNNNINYSGGDDVAQRKWRVEKLKHIRRNSYVVHLWNRHSKELRVENGSVIDSIKKGVCLFCFNNSSVLSFDL